MNYTINLNLAKIDKVFVKDITSQKTGVTKKCICVPVDSRDLFCGEKGVYLNLNAWEMKEGKFGDSHYLKVGLSKEVRDKLSSEDLKQLPIVGSMKELATSRQEAGSNFLKKLQEKENDSESEDLPFD